MTVGSAIAANWRYLEVPDPPSRVDYFCAGCGFVIQSAYFYDRSEQAEIRARVHADCALGNLPDALIAQHIAKKLTGAE